MNRPASMVVILALFSTVVLQSRSERATTLVRNSQNRTERTEKLEVRISPLESVIAVGNTLQLRVEIWNIGTQDVLVCKDFVRGPCDLRLSFDPRAKLPHAVASKDCVPYEWTTHTTPRKEDFAKFLVEDWVAVPAKHFYGGSVELDAGSYPELREVGRYRISGRFASGGPLEQRCYYKLKPFSKEISDLTAASWRGALDTNSVWVRVTGKKN